MLAEGTSAVLGSDSRSHKSAKGLYGKMGIIKL